MDFLNIINFIGNSYLSWKNIYNIIGAVLSAMLFYKTFYWLVGLFFTRKFKPAKNKHKYAILIAARNEKAVIGNLLDSIKKQDYPQELLTTFVVADNCTDNTAEIARNCGAICYERFDNEHKTKGFALQYLLEKIEEDYGRMSFEGYFIFDADNLLKKDYISRMNDAFDSGEKIITSYRNTKNFDENWVASTYALHWIRSIRCNHRARSVLRLATNIQGTGFLFTNEIVKNGWHYTSLTEDRALTADAVAQGYRISYQDEAMFYDEQPTSYNQYKTQRVRWIKGYFEARKKYIGKIIDSMDTNDKNYGSKLTEIIGVWHYIIMIIGAVLFRGETNVRTQARHKNTDKNYHFGVTAVITAYLPFLCALRYYRKIGGALRPLYDSGYLYRYLHS